MKDERKRFVVYTGQGTGPTAVHRRFASHAAAAREGARVARTVPYVRVVSMNSGRSTEWRDGVRSDEANRRICVCGAPAGVRRRLCRVCEREAARVADALLDAALEAAEAPAPAPAPRPRRVHYFRPPGFREPIPHEVVFDGT